MLIHVLNWTFAVQLKLREKKFRLKTHNIEEAFKAAIALGFFVQVRFGFLWSFL